MNTMDEYLVVNEGCFKKIQARIFSLSLSLLLASRLPLNFCLALPGTRGRSLRERRLSNFQAAIE